MHKNAIKLISIYISFIIIESTLILTNYFIFEWSVTFLFILLISARLETGFTRLCKYSNTFQKTTKHEYQSKTNNPLSCVTHLHRHNFISPFRTKESEKAIKLMQILQCLRDFMYLKLFTAFKTLNSEP